MPEGSGRGGKRPGAGRPKGSTAAAGSTSLSEARRQKEVHLAGLRRLELEERAGTLVQRARVVKAAADAGAQFKQALERLPVLALQFAAEADPDVISARLQAAVDETLADLVSALRRMADNPPA